MMGAIVCVTFGLTVSETRTAIIGLRWSSPPYKVGAAAGQVYISSLHAMHLAEYLGIYGHHNISQIIMDHKVDNPARVCGTGKINISLYPITPGNLFLARRVRPSRSASACSSFSTLKLHLVDFSRFPWRRPFSCLYRHTTSGQSRVFRVTQIGTQLFMYCVAMAFTTNSKFAR